MGTTSKFIGVLAAATLALAACSSDDTSSDPTAPDPGSATSDNGAMEVSASHNDADVTFATGMMPHHAQAVEMAKLADDRAESPAVKDLAADIEAAQDPEIELLTTMLQTWGEDVPDPDAGMDQGAASDNMGGMGHEWAHWASWAPWAMGGWG